MFLLKNQAPSLSLCFSNKEKIDCGAYCADACTSSNTRASRNGPTSAPLFSRSGNGSGPAARTYIVRKISTAAAACNLHFRSHTRSYNAPKTTTTAAGRGRVERRAGSRGPPANCPSLSSGVLNSTFGHRDIAEGVTRCLAQVPAFVPRWNNRVRAEGSP